MHEDKKYYELRDRPTVQLQVNDKFIQVRPTFNYETLETHNVKRLVRVTGIKKSRNTGSTIITLEDQTQFGARNDDSVTIYWLRPAFRPFGTQNVEEKPRGKSRGTYEDDLRKSHPEAPDAEIDKMLHDISEAEHAHDDFGVGVV